MKPSLMLPLQSPYDPRRRWKSNAVIEAWRREGVCGVKNKGEWERGAAMYSAPTPSLASWEPGVEENDDGTG